MLQYSRNIRVNLYKRSREGVDTCRKWICHDIKLSSRSESKQWDPIKPWGRPFFSSPPLHSQKWSWDRSSSTFLLPDPFVARPSGGHPQSSVWNNPPIHNPLFYSSMLPRENCSCKRSFPRIEMKSLLSIVFPFSIPRLEELLSLFRSAIAIGYLSKKIDESSRSIEIPLNPFD